MSTTKIAILTAQKCCGKTFIAMKLQEQIGCDLLRPDECVRDPLFAEFGKHGSIEGTVKTWKSQGAFPEVCRRSCELQRAALERLSGERIVTEWWLYHMRDIRQALYEAAQGLAGSTVEFYFAEFSLPIDKTIERIVSGHRERGLADKWKRWPKEEQQRKAGTRIEDWECRFEPPEAGELQLLDGYQRCESSEQAKAFLEGWLA